MRTIVTHESAPSSADEGPASRPGRPRLPRAVAAVTALWLAVMLAWSVLMPTFRSTDEIGHVSNGYYLLEVGDWPGYQELPLLTWVMAALPEEHPGYQPLTTGTPHPPPFAELRDATDRAEWFGEVSTTGQHPPGFYLLLAGALALLPEDIPAHATMWWLRLLNVLMLAPLPWLIARGAQRLRAPPLVVVTAAATPLAVPQLGALGGAVSNDNLMILTASAAGLLALYVATGDLRRRTAVVTGAVLAVALLTKAFALVLLPVVAGAYLLAGVRQGRIAQALRSGAVAAAPAVGAGGWWWLANLLRHGSLQPAGHQPPLPDGPLDAWTALPEYLEELVIRVPVRFWAALSIQIGEQPPPFPYGLTTALLAALLAGVLLVLLRRRSFAMGRAEAVLLLVPAFGTLAVMVAGTFPLYLRTGLPLGLQGRYLFVGFLGLTLVAVLGAAATVPPRLLRLLPAVVLGGGGLFTLLSLRKVAGFHWGRRDATLPEAAEALLAWSPLPIPALAVLALAVAATTTWTAGAVLRADVTRTRTSGTPGPSPSPSQDHDGQVSAAYRVDEDGAPRPSRRAE